MSRLVDSRPVSGYGVTFFRGNDEWGCGRDARASVWAGCASPGGGVSGFRPSPERRFGGVSASADLGCSPFSAWISGSRPSPERRFGGLLWADLPKPRFRSSRAAAMRWWGLKLLSSPTITFTRKRAMERPSSVSSRINLASSVSNLVCRLEFGLSRLGDESGVVSAMKLEASSFP